APLAVGVGAEHAVREPQLADDLGDAEVAVESLAPGRAEPARERAAGLRRHAQRAARRLRDEHGLDRVLRADVEQPLARAVVGLRVADHARDGDARLARELLAKALREVAHALELGLARAVQPALQLARAERLLAQAGNEALERRAVQIEEIDAHD